MIDARRRSPRLDSRRPARRLAAGLGLAALAALALATPRDASAEGGANLSAARSVGFQRGVTLADWGPTAYPPESIDATMRRLRRSLGARWVTLLAVWMQRDERATRIAPGRETVPTNHLRSAIDAAHRAGLKVILRPYIDRDDGGWRGAISPASVDAWFASYRRFLYRFATLAQGQGVEGFVVGSELNTMQDRTSQWRGIVRQIRLRFSGFLTYQGNWDTYASVAWWRDLDAIDISAYFPLATDSGYLVGDLERAWRDFNGRSWFAEIDALRREVGLPVIFGEIGYRTIEGSVIAPYDVDVVRPFSTADQRAAYLAALRVWYRVPWFRGFHWWYEPARRITGRGTDHTPAAPARRALKSWYRRAR